MTPGLVDRSAERLDSAINRYAARSAKTMGAGDIKICGAAQE